MADRTKIIRGPALVTFGGQTFYSKGDISVKAVIATFDVETSRFGKVDKRQSSRAFEISFEPLGVWSAGILPVLFPYATASIGSSIFGATDSALVVHTLAGKQWTFHNAAVTGMPNIKASVKETLLGSVTFTALLKKDTSAAVANAYYTVAAAAYPGDAGFDACAIKTLAYTQAWGAAVPWDSFDTEGGWEISFDLQTRDEEVDGSGVIDKTFQDLTVTASAVPVGPSPEDVVAAQDVQGEALGSCRAASGEDLNVFAAGVYLRVYNAQLDDADIAHGTDRKTVGKCDWMARRTVTGSALDPLFYVGVAAPV